MKNWNAHRIFLLDAIGAFVSGMMLMTIYFFNDIIGLPKNVILLFIGVALGLFFYSTTLYLIKPRHWTRYLTILAIMNLGYCLLTLYQIRRNQETITIFGLIYFLLEIIIIVGISIFELRKASQ